MFKTRSKKLQNILFGRLNHPLSGESGELHIQKSMTHPDGREIKWPGNDGLLFEFLKRIIDLEEEVEKLKKKK